MSSNPDYRPRVSFDVSEELYQRLQVLPWGAKRIVFERLVEDFISLYESHGIPVVGAVLSGDLKLGKEFPHGDD